MCRFEELRSSVYESALYSRIEISEHDYGHLKKLFTDTYNFDAYCAGCNETSIFFSDEEVHAVRLLANHFSGMSKTQSNPSTFIQLESRCARCDSVICVFLALTADSIIKIGQFPPAASLQAGAFLKYRRILGEHYEEFLRAAGSSAHGFGIGSFVYLKRIALRLIEEAHEKIKRESGWDEHAYRQSDMEEKLGLLSGSFDRETYGKLKSLSGILGKSMDKLSDEECRKHFGKLTSAIKSILDRKLTLEERDHKKRNSSLYRIDGLKKDAVSDKSATRMQTSA
ncbi:MAG: hypothetical protein ACOYU3_05960 [Bacillota bacterium]